MQHTTRLAIRPNRRSRLARLAAGVVIAASLTGSLQSLSAHAAPARSGARDTASATTGDCPASSSGATHWPALNDPPFGLVFPGQTGSSSETFVASSSGQLSATVTAGADIFQVTGMEVYRQTRVRVPVRIRWWWRPETARSAGMAAFSASMPRSERMRMLQPSAMARSAFV